MMMMMMTLILRACATQGATALCTTGDSINAGCVMLIASPARGDSQGALRAGHATGHRGVYTGSSAMTALGYKYTHSYVALERVLQQRRM